MKVGLVCPYDWSYPGGVRSHIRGLAESLRTKDIEAHIIAPASGTVEEDVFTAGRTFGLPANGSIARLCFSKSAAARVAEHVSQQGIELLHLHEPLIPSLSLACLMRIDVPAVGTFHASAPRSFGYRVARPFLRKNLSRLKGKIAVSAASEALVSRYFPDDYVKIPNGVDRARFADASVDTTVMHPFVLFVGRPEPRKGLQVAVAAVEKLRKTTPVDLVVVGPEASDVPEWVIALGPVGAYRLAAIYKAADVFCAPSLRGESFGIVLAEAMSAGTPVVCSDLPGYMEASAGACLHVEAGSVDGLTQGLRMVLEDERAADDLRQRGDARAKELDWGIVSSRIIDVYRSALS